MHTVHTKREEFHVKDELIEPAMTPIVASSTKALALKPSRNGTKTNSRCLLNATLVTTTKSTDKNIHQSNQALNNKMAQSQ